MNARCLIITLLLTSCATPAGMHTRYQQQIDEHTQRLNEDARDFLAKAKDMLASVADKTSDPELKQAIDMLHKSQVLLGSKIEDGEQLKNLTQEKLQEVVNKMYSHDKKILELIEKLDDKDKTAVAEVVTHDAQNQAVEKYRFWERFKLYSILVTVISVVGLVFFYIPSSASRSVLSWLGFLKKSNNDDATTKGS